MSGVVRDNGVDNLKGQQFMGQSSWIRWKVSLGFSTVSLGVL